MMAHGSWRVTFQQGDPVRGPYRKSSNGQGKMAENAIRYIIVTALFLILLNSAVADTTPQAEVRIGFNYPQTGPYAAEGLSQYNGALLAADEINAQGGILNHQIRLVSKDSGSHVSKTRINVRRLLEDKKVRMLFGGASSDVAIAACELCQEKWIPFFGTLTYSPTTTGEEGHRACFRESYNSWMAAKLLSRYLNDNLAGRHYYNITADYTWGWSTESAIRKLTDTMDHGIHPVSRMPIGSTNFIEPLRAAQAAKADVLIMTLAGNDIVTALRQATVMGLKDRMQIVIPNMMRDSLVEAGSDAIEGVIGTMQWLWQVPYRYQYQRGILFVEQYEKRYNKVPTSSAASAYTILHEYKAAVESAGSFDGPAVIRALEGRTYRIVKDTQRWREFDHQSIQTVYLVRGLAAEKSAPPGGTPKIVEIIDSMPGEQAARSHEEWLSVRRRAGRPIVLEHLDGGQ